MADVATQVQVQKGDLVPGRTYRVVFEDCCVEGFFAAEYLGHTSDGPSENNEDDDPYYWELQFKGAEVRMGCSFYELGA